MLTRAINKYERKCFLIEWVPTPNKLTKYEALAPFQLYHKFLIAHNKVGWMCRFCTMHITNLTSKNVHCGTNTSKFKYFATRNFYKQSLILLKTQWFFSMKRKSKLQTMERIYSFIQNLIIHRTVTIVIFKQIMSLMIQEPYKSLVI